MQIRRVQLSDAEAIAQIYNEYVLHTTVSFETHPIGIEEMRRRIQSTLPRYDWLVCEAETGVVGYAYYSSFRTRAAYNHTAESTIYLATGYTGRGIGRQLYSSLLDSARSNGLRELIGVIALPNEASVALHERLGFHAAGVLRRVGEKFGQYVDVGLWQLSL